VQTNVVLDHLSAHSFGAGEGFFPLVVRAEQREEIAPVPRRFSLANGRREPETT
jgi:hypothetical protein